MPGSVTLTSAYGPMIASITIEGTTVSECEVVDLLDGLVSLKLGTPDVAALIIGQRAVVHGLIIEADRLLSRMT